MTKLRIGLGNATTDYELKPDDIVGISRSFFDRNVVNVGIFRDALHTRWQPVITFRLDDNADDTVPET